MTSAQVAADQSESSTPDEQAATRPGVKSTWQKLSRLLPFKRSAATTETVANDPKPVTKLTFRQKLQQLTVSQWFYFFAFIALLFNLEAAETAERQITAVAVLAAIGLVRELWQVFHLIWNNPVGKGLIVVLYAGTANFALAISALKINAIAGIEPSPFIFTMAFTTLLMLPFWLAMASLLFLSLTLVAGNLWLLFSVFMRLLGVKLKVHWEDQSFVFVTMVLRIILIPIILFSLGMVINPYFKQLDLFDEDVPAFKMQQITPEQLEQLENTNPEDIQQLVDKLRQQQPGVLPIAVVSDNPALAANQSQQSQQDIVQSETTEAESAEEEAPGIGFLERLIGEFIYNFETYPYSQCQKLPGQRTLVIDENLVFVVQRDDSIQGFSYGVMECKPSYGTPPTSPPQPPAERPE